MNVLFDSDGLFALYVGSDRHHAKAKKIFSELFEANTNIFFVSNLVLQETATVLSYRFGQNVALDFLGRFQKMPITKIFIGEELEEESWILFQKQNKKGTSFIDCSNLALFESLKMDQIFSFDAFYQNKRILT